MKVINYIKKYGLESLTKEFAIKIKQYDDRIVLNYNQIESPKFHHIIKECRGLILSLPDYNTLSRSFDRFYNLNEDPKTKEFDITKAICYEKIDGSLCNIYHDKKEWQIATRGMAFAEGINSFGNSFRDIFLRSFQNFSETFNSIGNKDCTYIFELVSPETRIVTPYSDYKTYLLAVRNKYTGKYWPQNIIDKVPKNLGICLPKKYYFQSINEVLDQIKTLPKLEEGYVCYIPEENWRIKIKNPSYLAVAHMRENGILNKKNVIILVYNQDYEEYLSMFPEDRKIFEGYIKAYERMIKGIHSTWERTKTIKDQKEFALQVKNLPIASVLFRLRKNHNLEQIFNSITIDSKIRMIEKYMND